MKRLAFSSIDEVDNCFALRSVVYYRRGAACYGKGLTPRVHVGHTQRCVDEVSRGGAENAEMKSLEGGR